MGGKKECCDEKGLAIEIGRGVLGEHSLIQTYERKQGKLNLDQAEDVFWIWAHSWYDVFGIWDLDMWVEIVAFRSMWWGCKVWSWKVILRRKTDETLLTSALSVVLSWAVMKPWLCITLFVPLARSILGTFVHADHMRCCGAAERHGILWDHPCLSAGG